MRGILAGIAQLVEQLICNQQVVGSNPTAGSCNLRLPIADFRLSNPNLGLGPWLQIAVADRHLKFCFDTFGIPSHEKQPK